MITENYTGTEYFSSDWHFNHVNITGPKVSRWKSGYRDFNSTSEMNEHLIKCINNTVKENDTLYFLGDFCFGDHTLTPTWRYRLHCKNIYWIKGNHDDKQYLYRDIFLKTTKQMVTEVNRQKIYLSHYKHAIWDGSHKGYWHLYGHSHDKAENWEIGKSMDVGVDTAKRILGEYRPFSFQELKEILDKREINHYKKY